MIIGYARVSTRDQDPQPQLDALAGAGCAQVFDETMTGTFRDRPQLAACLRTLQQGDAMVVWKLDRLARSLKDLVEIIHGLDQRGVGFRSLTESIDTTNAGGRHVVHIFGALAEFEHSLIRERTVAGLAAARARGRKGGRKPALSAADVRKAAAMLSNPKTTKADVARHFGISRVTLNAALARAGIVDPLARASALPAPNDHQPPAPGN